MLAVGIEHPLAGARVISKNIIQEIRQSVSVSQTKAGLNAAAVGGSPQNGDPWLAGGILEIRIHAEGGLKSPGHLKLESGEAELDTEAAQ